MEKSAAKKGMTPPRTSDESLGVQLLLGSKTSYPSHGPQSPAGEVTTSNPPSPFGSHLMAELAMSGAPESHTRNQYGVLTLHLHGMTMYHALSSNQWTSIRKPSVNLAANADKYLWRPASVEIADLIKKRSQKNLK